MCASDAVMMNRIVSFLSKVLMSFAFEMALLLTWVVQASVLRWLIGLGGSNVSFFSCFLVVMVLQAVLFAGSLRRWN